MKNDIDTVLDLLERSQARIEELQSTVLQQQAMINAILLCLRDRTESDPKELEKLFNYYQKIIHQELLKANKKTEPVRTAGLENNPS
ncbi:MAG TPA: hypothetical protein VK811_10210 [Candidatus Acidoferrum sp.]|jgi:hypothetical protein|nr:hypothetical protein [Candidatus Acidoferrum sp.]